MTVKDGIVELYEIVELDNGDVALQPTTGEGETLVSIRFSKTSEKFLAGNKYDVAKAMISAGLDCLNDHIDVEGASEEEDDLDEDELDLIEERDRILH